MNEADVKKLVVEKLLGEQTVVQLAVLPIASGVEIPEYLKTVPQLITLEIGLDMPKPIPDLEVNEHGIRATLSFPGNASNTRQAYQCWLPWHAVLSVGPPYTYWAPSAELQQGAPPKPERSGLKLVR